METILQPSQWPVALSNFVTWCLMWDPKNRPTSTQAMNHEYFVDAVDPLRLKPPTSRLLGRKHSAYDTRSPKETVEIPPLTSKSSWFRKPLIGRDSAPAVPQHHNTTQITSPSASSIHSSVAPEISIEPKPRPQANKRATWTNGTTPSIGAPMPILPSIRPISPLSATVTAQANSSLESDDGGQTMNTKKIGRQLSVASNGSHYADLHRQEAERTLNAYGGLASPTNGQKESFFSHLRKRARRLSGRHQTPLSPKYGDIEANAGCAPWASNRSSMALDQHTMAEAASKTDFTELDRALENVRYNLEVSSPAPLGHPNQLTRQSSTTALASPGLKRNHSVARASASLSMEHLQTPDVGPGPISSRTRRALQLSTHPAYRYETPDEEDELLDEALHGMQRAVKGLDRNSKPDANNHRNALASKDNNRRPPQNSTATNVMTNPYPTPSPSEKRNGVVYNNSLMGEPATPLNITKARPKENATTSWPTPPYEDNEWAASAAASIFAAGSLYQ